MAETTRRRPETEQDEKQKREMPGAKKNDGMKGEKKGEKSRKDKSGKHGDKQGKKSREGRDDWEEEQY